MLIKSRSAKNSERGVYIQDKELAQTIFTPGSHFKYIVDPQNRTMVILQADKGNTVSKRTLKDRVKPVIDIRDKKALSAFSTCDYLQVEIHRDQVIVKGYEAEAKTSILQKAKQKVKQFIGQTKVRDIQDFLSVKQKHQVVLSRRQLAEAVGQYSLFDFMEEELSLNQSLSSALQHPHIPLELVSLFSGAGIMDLGFTQEGFKIIHAVEKDPDACATYRANHGNHIVCADINAIDLSTLPKAPIMIAGSPCQGFSNSNRQTNFLDNPNNQLVVLYIEAIRANENCQVFVLENVRQILTAGNGRFRDEIYDALSDFEITSGVLCAADYGTAQLRDRAIFIGSKIGKIELPRPTFFTHRTVRGAFQYLHDGVPNQLDVTTSKPETLERMTYIPQGGNWRNLPAHLQPSGERHSIYFRRLEWDRPAPTILNPRKNNILHPEKHATLSVREAARLADVPDDFVIHGNLSSRQQQIANCVPVRLAREIANVVRNAVMQFNIRNRKVLSFV